MILLSAGHYPESPGACHNGFCEHEEAVRWVDILVRLLSSRIDVEIVPTGRLLIRDPATKKIVGGKIHWINEQKDVSLACEIHFNSDVSKQQVGSETLYCPGSVKGRNAARTVQDAMSSLLAPNRGAKEGWYQMILPPDPRATPDVFLSETNPVALILEPEFIYNRLVIESLREVVCEVLSDAIVEAANAVNK